MTITNEAWDKYISALRRLDTRAYELMKSHVEKYGITNADALIKTAYNIARTFGRGSAALSAEMFEAVSYLAGHPVTAEMAETASFSEVAKTVNGTLKESQNADKIASSVTRLVKLAGEDTMLLNAKKNNAQYAWVPRGDTCPYCVALASRGWQDAYLTDGSAEHVHANCDCHYAIRYDSESGVADYDPGQYMRIYRGAEGKTSRERLNSLAREHYAANKEEINRQHREAYQKRMENTV